MNLKFAIIPWSNNELNDGLFYNKDENNNCVPKKTPLYNVKKEFERKGDELHTIDIFHDLSEVDYFLFFELDWMWVKKIVKMGSSKKMVYCNAEPPAVKEINCPDGYKFLKKIFPYILTWNREWVDNKSVFKRNIAYYFQEDFGEIPFEQRKLVTGISANKCSKHPYELYSERAKIYEFFEKNYPDSFDFYGVGWNKMDHPCYRGTVASKSEVYHQYRFAICLENTKNIKDYVTEKIWDCLCSGIVPIYGGAENINEYIPSECYINYFQFKSISELADYLLNMSKEEYQQYLDAAKKLLLTNVKEVFSGETYAADIYNAVNHEKMFEISSGYKAIVYAICAKINLVNNLKKNIKKIIHVKRK